MRHLVYNIRHSVVSFNSSLLTVTIYSWVITTLVYNDTIILSLFHDVISEFNYILYPFFLSVFGKELRQI
jgi:hypothetical protein